MLDMKAVIWLETYLQVGPQIYSPILLILHL